MNFKKMASLSAILSLFCVSNFAYSAIGNYEDEQMVNLNIQIKGKKKSLKTDIAVPFYQTAELEKKLDNKDLMFEVNPKKGKFSNEIDLEVRILNKKGSKVVAKKEITAKFNKESVIAMKGVIFKVTPEI